MGSTISALQHERRLVQAFSYPRTYPHPVGRIIHHETHISHVFLAGRFAYKLKKPKRFAFVDTSTLRRRKRLCELEVRLNRRLAPWMYLGVVPVIASSQGLRLGGRGRLVEWAVKMQRLPEDRMLDRLIRTRRATRHELDRVMARLLPFFRRAKRAARFGHPALIAELLLGNLQECRAFVGALLSRDDLQAIEAVYRQCLLLREPVLRRRLRAGWIRDGHGDLRCENICVSHPVAIFDCVEFEPAFRCGDVANELAFLLMDLEFRGRPDLAEAALARYQRRMHDPTLASVLTMYQCHRRLVRGKVRGLLWLQHKGRAFGRRHQRLARRHFQLARRYAQQCAPPLLLVVGGLIGTGKSTLARRLSHALGAEWLRTDEIRRRAFSRWRRPGQGFQQGLYAPRVSARVYRRLTQRAGVLLRRGLPVVCDGTFLRAQDRQRLHRLASRSGSVFHFFECVAPPRVARQRVSRRLRRAQADRSEARPDYYERLRERVEPVRGWSVRDWTRLPTTRAVGDVSGGPSGLAPRVTDFPVIPTLRNSRPPVESKCRRLSLCRSRLSPAPQPGRARGSQVR